MSIDDEFIQTIIASPDDDMPRLVYADWLDEQGDPRGEFIRVQCELAKMAEDDPRRWDLELRQGRLLRKYGWQWWPNPFDPRSPRPEFKRGFLEERSLMVAVELFLADAESYFRCYPFLEHLKLMYGTEQDLPALLELPKLGQLTSLEIDDGMTAAPYYRSVAPTIRKALQARFGSLVK